MKWVFTAPGTPDNEAIGLWVAQQLGYDEPWDADLTASVAAIQDERLMGAVIYHDWRPNFGTIAISVASDTPRWLTRAGLRAIMAYPFKEAGCQMVIAETSENNSTVCRICRALGAREHRVERLRGENEAGIIFTMTREEWQDRHGIS